MFRRFLVIILAAFPLCAALEAKAQAQPNFSGAWVQDNSKSTVPPNWTAKYTNQIEHRVSKLTVATTFSGGNRPDTTFTRSYSLDGKPVSSKDREGDEIVSTAQWKGRSIEIDTVEKESEGEIKSVETWTLSDDGKTLTKAIHTTGPRGVTDRKYVLNKQ